MNSRQLKKIERANVILGVAATALAGLLWGPRGMAGAAVGAALACLNFTVLHRLGSRVIRRALAGGSAGQAVGLAVGLMLKMTALFALVWVALRVLMLPLWPFALGFSGFVISIVLVGLFADVEVDDGERDGAATGERPARVEV